MTTKYYKTRMKAEEVRRSGDLIYYDFYKGYNIVPRREPINVGKNILVEDLNKLERTNIFQLFFLILNTVIISTIALFPLLWLINGSEPFGVVFFLDAIWLAELITLPILGAIMFIKYMLKPWIVMDETFWTFKGRRNENILFSDLHLILYNPLTYTIRVVLGIFIPAMVIITFLYGNNAFGILYPIAYFMFMIIGVISFFKIFGEMTDTNSSRGLK